jgi:hypothetical protein
MKPQSVGGRGTNLGRWGEPPREIVVDHLVGDLVRDHVADDECRILRGCVGMQGSMSLDFLHVKKLPSMARGKQMSPHGIPLGPPAGLLGGEQLINTANRGHVIAVDGGGATRPSGSCREFERNLETCDFAKERSVGKVGSKESHRMVKAMGGRAVD